MPIKSFTLIALLLLTTTISKAQVITGKITTPQSNPIDKAIIHLLNTNTETTTDALGMYKLPHILPGKYVIEVIAAGYATKHQAVLVTPAGASANMQLTEATIQLDAVVVTAQKKEESLQSIPISITALSAKQVKEYRLWDIKDITAIAPNMLADNPGDGRNIVSIRGIVNTSYDPSVATNIDGVNQFSLDTYIGNLNDIERIEIMRGPQGTLYGRNAMGGVINIITKQPSNTTNGWVELTMGNYGQQRYNAAIRIPLIKNKLFFGANGSFNKRDGFYTNSLTKASFDKQEGLSGNYYLKFLPNTKWDINFNLKFQNNKNDGTFPLVNGVEESFNNPFVLAQNALAKMHDNTLNASLVINKKGSSFQFSSISSWQRNHRNYDAPLDADFSPADAVTIINNYGNDWNTVKVFTQEFRLSSPSSKTTPFKWTAGTYFFSQDNPSKQATHFGKDAGLIGSPISNFSSINTTVGKNTGIAFYGQTNYAISKKIELTAGLRYDYENKKLAVKGEFQKDGSAAFVTQPDTSTAVGFSALSPTIGLNYQSNKNTNLFISYKRGYRTGGLTQLSSDPSQPPLYAYKPEYSNNFELGIKNEFFDNRLRLNITAFVTGVTDAQVPTLILPDAITITKNTGKLSSKGVELELFTTPVKGLQIDYNFGYTNAKYGALQIAQNGSSTNLNGAKQIYTPEITSMLALQYGYAIGNKKATKLITRLEWRYLGTQYFDLANQIKQTPYSIINARIGIATKHFEFFLWNRNIGNTKYIAYAYDFGAVHLGNPNTYGTSVMINL